MCLPFSARWRTSTLGNSVPREGTMNVAFSFLCRALFVVQIAKTGVNHLVAQQINANRSFVLKSFANRAAFGPAFLVKGPPVTGIRQRTVVVCQRSHVSFVRIMQFCIVFINCFNVVKLVNVNRFCGAVDVSSMIFVIVTFQKIGIWYFQK